MADYKYLLWDIDGTVLDFLAAEKAAIKDLFLKYGFGECTDEMVDRYSAINVKYWRELEKGKMTKAQILTGRFREFFAIEGIEADVESFNLDYQLALGDTIVFIDGALEMLEKEKGRYVLIAITNGTKRAQSKKLKVSGLDQIFDYIFISEDVGVEKPSPGYFEKVMDTAGITDRSEALVIGDSLTSDIAGGLRAGLATCWFNPGGAPNDKGMIPDMEIRSLYELEGILENTED
ncbi:MAG: noncanonical pyrimidine nucleotidase, YjjG family [Lachnospiraceae bacterium]|nr:noncanonical pyrimidine nucleotidase, YjjG family [Lachnospiraceae bacterium]